MGCDKYVLAMEKKTIRDAGCEMRLLAENIPTEGAEGILIEGLMDAMAEYYSRNLEENIQRGMDYNAQRANYNGHKIFGYGVEQIDKHGIKAYFEKFLHADFDNPETRDMILEYFVDKIYFYDEKLVVTSWYSEDETEITWDMLKGADGDPFVKGEAAEFDCFPFGSTTCCQAGPDAGLPVSFWPRGRGHGHASSLRIPPRAKYSCNVPKRVLPRRVLLLQ